MMAELKVCTAGQHTSINNNMCTEKTLVSKEHQTAETHIGMSLHNIKRLFADHWRRQTVLRVVVVEQVRHHSWWEEEQDGVCVCVCVCVCACVRLRH